MKKVFLVLGMIIMFCITLTAQPIFDTLIDGRDGKSYKTVKIGNQVWMAENLAFLPSVNKVTEGSENIAGAYYYVYNYNGTDVNAAKASSNYTTYGVLYNWTAAMTNSTSSTANPSGVQGICPKGWHLPSVTEWTQLTTYLGGVYVAGSKLKEIGTTHWNSKNTDATNETGFTALPGGYRFYDDTFGYIGGNGCWWSATENGTYSAWDLNMKSSYNSVGSMDSNKELGFSVRCIKDY